MSEPYKRPESVLVVVYTQAGEVLLLRRREPADFWQSVTGSLGWEEAPEQAARRELREETGLVPEETTPQATGVVNRFPIYGPWRARYAPQDRENTEHVFTLRLVDRVAVRLNPREHAEYRWLSAEEAACRATSWTNRDAIRHLVVARLPGDGVR